MSNRKSDIYSICSCEHARVWLATGLVADKWRLVNRKQLARIGKRKLRATGTQAAHRDEAAAVHVRAQIARRQHCFRDGQRVAAALAQAAKAPVKALAARTQQ